MLMKLTLSAWFYYDYYIFLGEVRVFRSKLTVQAYCKYVPTYRCL